MDTGRALARDKFHLQSVEYAAACPACGAAARWVAAHLLWSGRPRWDTEYSCAACGSAAAICGVTPDDALRERLLAANGSTTLRVPASAHRASVMRVLRAVLGLGLAEVREALERALAGRLTGTRPEMEQLARALRRAGVAAETR
ncbi:hypothetical protein [Streptomyces tritici]|uniref:hypothetical protein n=1 Tax=Streptomyces tritici TaxID=2054410 RepID=UPI003AF1A029